MIDKKESRFTQRERKFITLYTDETNRLAYGNATQSAIGSGYKESCASKMGWRLLQKSHVKEEIAKIKKETQDARKVSKDQAVLEARLEYERATKPYMKKFWWMMWIQLQGWLVTKSESQNTVTVDARMMQEEIYKIVRDESRGLPKVSFEERVGLIEMDRGEELNNNG